jgi:hypothetical protein
MQPAFDALRSELTKADYRVVGSKVLLSDPGRPDGREIRYFNREDEAQAGKIAEYLTFKDPKNPIATKQYGDSTARPGYIEIWLGR